MDILPILFIVLGLCCPYLTQRVAPGVPPQHYDPNQNQQYMQHQPPPPPQYQQQQQQHQQYQQHQVPVQQQQQHIPQQFQNPDPHGHGAVPVQQQQHQQQQQVPQGQGHGHGAPSGHGSHSHMPHGGAGGQPLLDAAQIVQERQHIQEHMDVPIDTSQMSEQELQFHYFKMHDADNNNKLDGCELVKSLIHWHDQSNHDQRGGAPIPEAKIFKDEELVQMIDPILDNDDKNKDGFIDYAEFVQAQAAAAAKVNPVPQAA